MASINRNLIQAARFRTASGGTTARSLVDAADAGLPEQVREALPISTENVDPLRELVGMITQMRGAGIADDCILTVLERGLLPQRPELATSFEAAKTATGLKRRWYKSRWFIGLAAAVGGVLVGGTIVWAVSRD